MMELAPAKKNIAVILNGISLKKKFFYRNILPRLSKIANVEVFETLSKNDAISLANKVANKSVDLIIAAGGDGTLNQVVNGVLKGRESDIRLPVIGLIPLGSGNDFARTVKITSDIDQLEKLITQFKPKPIDVGKISFTTDRDSPMEERYFVNVADLGMGPMVVDKVSKSARPFGHGFAYYYSILSTFVSYETMKVKATSAEWSWEGKLRTLAVGNGKYYGHGLCIAPDALIDDRKFSVFLCGDVSALDFIWHTSKLKKGQHIRIREISYRDATSISLTSEGPCMIEGDGEILGNLPANVKMIERQLQFLI